MSAAAVQSMVATVADQPCCAGDDKKLGPAGAASLAEALPGLIQLQQLNLGGEQHLFWVVLYGWLCVWV